MTTAETLIIREACEEDSFQLVHLLAELGYPVTVEFVAQQLRTFAEGRLGWMFVAAEGETIVGLVSYHQYPFYHMPGLYGRVTGLVVDDRYRRQGIGKKLMDFIEQFAREQGAVRMELNSAYRRVEAHAFYESLGYGSDAKRFVKKL